MSENEILKVYAEGISSVVNLVKNLSAKIDSLNNNVNKLRDYKINNKPKKIKKC